MSRNPARQKLAPTSAPPTSSTDAATRAAAVKELTDGIGVDAAIEGVGTGESMRAVLSTRPGRPSATSASPTTPSPLHGAVLPPRRPRGGPAPVRRYLPEHLDSSTAASSPARSSTSPDPSTASPRPTGPWTTAEPIKTLVVRIGSI